jgi:hypothetical protein
MNRFNFNFMPMTNQMLLFAAILSFTACSKAPSVSKGISPSANARLTTLPAAHGSDFNTYWYAGKAELSTYQLEQDRYGEKRTAEQVNIFVTEDFSASKQVKLDNAQEAGDDKVPVLKLNSVRRFETGIYDYSLMSSVFTPIESDAATLKLNATIQDWCGHTFTQINRLDKAWRWRQFSYFESEADTEALLEDCVLEDELFSQLRLKPEAWNNRQVRMLPGLFYLRMKHLPSEPKNATISSQVQNGNRLTTVQYTDLPRTIRITQESAFPYRILDWEEQENDKILVKAYLVNVVATDYWAKNGNQYSGWRDSLKLR